MQADEARAALTASRRALLPEVGGCFWDKAKWRHRRQSPQLACNGRGDLVKNCVRIGDKKNNLKTVVKDRGGPPKWMEPLPKARATPLVLLHRSGFAKSHNGRNFQQNSELPVTQMLVSPANCSGCKTDSETMDDMTLRSDTVLSDVHLHTPSKRHLMIRLNAVSQPVFLSHFKLLLDKNDLNPEKKEKNCQKENMGHQDKYAERISAKDSADDRDTPSSPEKEGSALKEITALLDEDGDLEVIRKPPLPEAETEYCSRDKVCPIILTKGGDVLEEEEQGDTCADIIKIEHTMATPLEDVGKQVWRGAFLLADFILSNPDLFKDRVVLELGGGTGIVSIVVAKAAKTIYCTDVGEDLLDMCERNVALNKCHTEPAGSIVKVRVLDWLKDEFCTDPDNSYHWSEKEIAELHSLTTVILAADVFYDDYLTDAFFKTLYRITHNLKNPCTVYLSIEKRLNFTLRHMDVTCEAYSHFRKALNDLVDIRDGKMSYTVEPVQLSFPQHIVYERIEQLELWKITAGMASETSGLPGD